MIRFYLGLVSWFSFKDPLYHFYSPEDKLDSILFYSLEREIILKYPEEHHFAFSKKNMKDVNEWNGFNFWHPYRSILKRKTVTSLEHQRIETPLRRICKPQWCARKQGNRYGHWRHWIVIDYTHFPLLGMKKSLYNALQDFGSSGVVKKRII